MVLTEALKYLQTVIFEREKFCMEQLDGQKGLIPPQSITVQIWYTA